MKTLADLQKIREQALHSMSVREGQQRCKIVVAMGTCGIACGAREVMTAVLSELDRLGVTDVAVTQSGCMGLCDKEPTMDVVISGESVVTYGYVTPEKARSIVDKHVLNNQIQSDWVVRQ